MKPLEQSGLYPALTDKGVPPKRAAAKIQSTRKGWVMAVGGAILVALGFAFVIFVMRETKAAPSIPLLIFAALPALPGGYYILAGGHLISGEAMGAAEKTGGLISRSAARALRLARGKE